jgi:hypothetical protein
VRGFGRVELQRNGYGRPAIAIIKLGTLWPGFLENIDQEPVWTISRDLNIDLLPRRIAMNKEAASGNSRNGKRQKS